MDTTANSERMESPAFDLLEADAHSEMASMNEVAR